MAEEKLLAVFAHPDDESFICGGTLAKITKRGGHVTLVCATKGEMGRRMGKPAFATRESLPILRDKELVNACEALGIQELRYLGIMDKTVEYQDFDHLVGRIVRQIRETRPQVLLTFHPKYGGHPDHCAIGKAAEAAYSRAADPAWYPEQLEEESLDVYLAPRLYFLLWHHLAEKPKEIGVDPAQITSVDISSASREKVMSLRAHRSQTELHADLWRGNPDKTYAGSREYFLQVSKPWVKGESDLFENVKE